MRARLREIARGRGVAFFFAVLLRNMRIDLAGSQ